MANLWCETLDAHLKWRVGIGDSTADVDKEMLLVRVLVTIVLHKGGMFKKSKSGGCNAPGQPRWTRRGLRKHRGWGLGIGGMVRLGDMRAWVWQAVRKVVGEGFDVFVLRVDGVVEAWLPKLGRRVARDRGVVGMRHPAQKSLLVHHSGGDNLS